MMALRSHVDVYGELDDFSGTSSTETNGVMKLVAANLPFASQFLTVRGVTPSNLATSLTVIKSFGIITCRPLSPKIPAMNALSQPLRYKLQYFLTIINIWFSSCFVYASNLAKPAVF